MGSKVIAECQCGFREGFWIGGGMNNLNEVCYFPCLCEQCSRAFTGNLFNKTSTCPKCCSKKIIPYDDARLQGSTGDQEVTSWNVKDTIGRELSVNNGTYRCPKCHAVTLGFALEMMWD